MRILNVSILTFAACIGSACVTSRYQSGAENPEARIVLASSKAEQCEVLSEGGRWFLLFGALPIGAWSDPPPIAPPPGNSIRITERSEWQDWMVTIAGGWLITATRRTFVVEGCAEDVQVHTSATRAAELQQGLDALARSSAQVVVVMKSGENHAGRVLEISESEILLQPTGAVEQGDSAPELVDRVEMKDGQVLEGRITNQTVSTVTIEINGAAQRLQKATIRRIELRVAATPPPSENLRLARNEISRLVLRP